VGAHSQQSFRNGSPRGQTSLFKPQGSKIASVPRILVTLSWISVHVPHDLANEVFRRLISGLVDKYFVPNFFPTVKFSTQKRYRLTLTNHLIPAFGKARLADIGTLEIQRFVLAKIESGLSWEYADHFRNLLSKLFETAKKWGYHSGPNPATGVELPEKTPVRAKHVLELGRIPGLLNVLKEPVRTMVELALLTGLRIGEILALDWANVDLAAGAIHVTRAYYRGSMGTPKTKSSRRCVPLPEALKERLRALREKALTPEELVFHTSNGIPFNDSNLLHRDLKPAGCKLGMP
jgi:integrase